MFGYTRRRKQRGAGQAAVVSKTTPRPASHPGDTPLIDAVRSGNIDAVESVYTPELLNATNNAGNTALHVAVWRRFLSAVIFLLGKGADPNMLNNSGESSLHLAIENSSLEIIQYLIHHGASISVKTRNGKNALNIAKAHKRTNIFHILPRRSMPAGLQIHLSPSTYAYASRVPAGLFDLVKAPEDFERTAVFLKGVDLCTGVDGYFQDYSLKNANYILCAMTTDNEPVGIATLNIINDDVLEVKLFCSDYKYKGIGSFMMSKIKEFKTALALQAIELESVSSATEFYRKLGFVEKGKEGDETMMIFRGGSRRQHRKCLKTSTRRR